MLTVAIVAPIESLHLRSKPNPLEKYFKRDAKRLNIFDYNAAGLVPDKFDALAPKLQGEAPNGADPKQKSIREAQLGKMYEEQKKDVEQFFSGRKVMNDCPTFPYCNHIPAPPPVLPPPSGLQQADANIAFPWNINDAKSERNEKYSKQPFTKASPVADKTYTKLHNSFTKRLYNPSFGHIGIPGGMSGLKTETNPSYATTVEEMKKVSLDKVYKNARLANLGPGMREEADPGTNGYQPPGKIHMALDGGQGKQDNDAPSKDSSSDGGH